MRLAVFLGYEDIHEPFPAKRRKSYAEKEHTSPCRQEDVKDEDMGDAEAIKEEVRTPGMGAERVLLWIGAEVGFVATRARAPVQLHSTR